MGRFGLLGEKLAHSYSPEIHARLADYEYRIYEKKREELDDFIRNGDWQGLNVTIPYKTEVIPYCDELEPEAACIGSVNTLVRRGDRTLYGANTDAYGFRAMIQKSGITAAGKKVLVLGSGGASKTAVAVMRALSAREVIVISRSGKDNYENLYRHQDAEIIVNTTPVGMYPSNGKAPLSLTAFPKCCGVLDIVYNPARTALLLQAEKLRIPYAGGLHMLVAQAKRSAELFTGQDIPNERIGEIEEELEGSMQNIILIGMPGCGKTTIARILGRRLGRPVLDTDLFVEEKAGCSIPEIFEKFGEEFFRKLETEVLAEVGKLSGQILATGGGCVTRDENYPLLHQNGKIVWIVRPITQLEKTGRPLSQRQDAEEMYRKRAPLYRAFSDFTAENSETPERAADQICAQLADAPKDRTDDQNERKKKP